MKVRQRKDGELYAHSEQTNTVYSFDGTPYTAPGDVDKWPVVAEVPSLFDWLQDPGQYHNAYLYGAMVPDAAPDGAPDDRPAFVFGGSFLYATTWAEEHGYHIGVFRHMYNDRNLVRRLAEDVGGVAW